MDCREAMQWLSDAVDKRLERNLDREIFEHLERCKNCRSEYEMERLTKEGVRRRLVSVKAPPPLVERVSESLVTVPVERTFFSAVRAFSGSRTFRWSVAAGLAIILVLVGVNVLDRGAGSRGDVLANTEKNYDAMRMGNMVPKMVAYEAERVQEYFNDQATFRVMVPAIDQCAYISGLVSMNQDVQEAHILFKMDDSTYLYCYQVDVDKAMADQTFTVPDEAVPMLDRNEWYIKSTGDRTMMLWKVGNTLCAAVSSMEKEEMRKLLAAND